MLTRWCLSETLTFQGAVTYVDPCSERHYPGIAALRDQLSSWQWVFGHTPPFKVKRTFVEFIDGRRVELTIHLSVQKGRIEEATFSAPGADCEHYAPIFAAVSDSLKGVRFWEDDIGDSVREADCRPSEMTTFIRVSLHTLHHHSTPEQRRTESVKLTR